MVALKEQFQHGGTKTRSWRFATSISPGFQNRPLVIDHCSLIFERSAAAYGNTLICTGPGLDGVWFTDDDVQSDYGANEIVFCGYCYDAETQLYYVRNRTYNPILGRWIQRDPIGYSGGINLYGYVKGRAAAAVDPDGRVGVGVIGTGSVGGGVVVGAGATGSVGGGVFIGPQGGSVGGFVSGGAAAGGPGSSYGAPGNTGQTDFFTGGFLGIGRGGFLTNAGSVSQLGGPFHQWNLDLEAFSISFEYSNGIWVLNVAAGPGVGAAVTGYSTTTATAGTRPTWNLCPKPPGYVTDVNGNLQVVPP